MPTYKIIMPSFSEEITAKDEDEALYLWDQDYREWFTDNDPRLPIIKLLKTKSSKL